MKSIKIKKVLDVFNGSFETSTRNYGKKLENWGCHKAIVLNLH